MLLWTKYCQLSIRRGQGSCSIFFICVSCEGKDYYRGGSSGEGAGDVHPSPPPPRDEAFFFVFAFKICLPHQSVTPFLRGSALYYLAFPVRQLGFAFRLYCGQSRVYKDVLWLCYFFISLLEFPLSKCVSVRGSLYSTFTPPQLIKHWFFNFYRVPISFFHWGINHCRGSVVEWFRALVL